jgi:hypothetical protein
MIFKFIYATTFDSVVRERWAFPVRWSPSMDGISKQEDYDETVAESSPHILAMSPTHGSHPS